MTCDPNKRQRRSIRLPGYDYDQPGAYFVTVCTEGHVCLFGRVVGEAMEWNNAGRTVDKCWREIPAHFPQVTLDEFIVMPNHVHGILVIAGANDDPHVGANNHSPALLDDTPPRAADDSFVRANDYSPLPTNRPPPRPRGTSKTIGSIIRGFKIGVAKWMRENAGVRDVWQRNYFEHIIRNDVALNRIRQYILDNPVRWAYDRYNPLALHPETDDPWRE
jgi:REP element-mobilizing transposase RayT